MPYMLQQGMNGCDVVKEVHNRYPHNGADVQTMHYFKLGELHPRIIPILCEILPTLTPEILREHSIETDRFLDARGEILYLPKVRTEADKHGVRMFKTWLRLQLCQAGYLNPDIVKLGILDVGKCNLERQLYMTNVGKFRVDVWALMTILLDIHTIADVPYLPECWDVNAMWIDNAAREAQCHMLKAYLERNGILMRDVDRAIGWTVNQLSYFIQSCTKALPPKRAIPFKRWVAIREFLGWLPPKQAPPQVKALKMMATKCAARLDAMNLG